MNWKLGALAIALAIIAVAWAFTSWQSAQTRLEDAYDQQNKVFALIQEVKQLKSKNSGQIAVMPADYDYTKDISNALEKCGIRLSGSLNATTFRTLEDSGMKFRSVNNPIKEPVTLRQLLQFIGQVYDSPAKYNLDSLRITATKREAGAPEKWNAEFQLLFCQQSNQ